MKNPHDIILRPVLTEKSYDGMTDKRYVFEVAINANKIEIKQAVEAAFGVKVETNMVIGRVLTVEELKEELAAIRQQYLSSLPSEFVWQTAIIGDNDRIFLPDHQEQAWSNKADSLLHVEAAHYQQELFNEVIMNIK